jgi:antitoxin PrlF
VTVVSSKGQVVIPSRLRKQLGLATGHKLLIITDGERLMMERIRAPEVAPYRRLIRRAAEWRRKAVSRKRA